MEMLLTFYFLYGFIVGMLISRSKKMGEYSENANEEYMNETGKPMPVSLLATAYTVSVLVITVAWAPIVVYNLWKDADAQA